MRLKVDEGRVRTSVRDDSRERRGTVSVSDDGRDASTVSREGDRDGGKSQTIILDENGVREADDDGGRRSCCITDDDGKDRDRRKPILVCDADGSLIGSSSVEGRRSRNVERPATSSNLSRTRTTKRTNNVRNCEGIEGSRVSPAGSEGRDILSNSDVDVADGLDSRSDVENVEAKGNSA